MTEKILNKQNLIRLGFFALCFHAVTMHLYCFMDISVPMIVSYVFLGITATAAILYFAKNRIPVRFQPAQMLLIAFMLWFIISCISMGVTFDNDWVDHNAFPMLNTAVSMFLAFPLGYVWIREKNGTVKPAPAVLKKSGTRRFDLDVPLLHILLLCWTVFIAYVLIRIFQGQTIPTPNGGIIRMKKGLEINCNRNITGAWEMLAFLLCFYMAFRCKPVSLKIGYGVSSVIHYFALALSNSRTSILASLIGFTAMVGIVVYLRLEKNKKPHRVLYAIASAIIAGMVFYFLTDPIFKLYNATTGSSASVRSAAGDSTLNGRTRVWKYSIDGIFSSFRTAVFGVTPMSVKDLIYQASNNITSMAHCHNEFLQIAASNGIPALCIFLGWFFIILKSTYKLFFVRKDRTVFLMIPMIVLALLLANMMESFLVYGYDITGFAFFLLCGIVYGKANEPLSEPFSLQAIRNRLRKK